MGWLFVTDGLVWDSSNLWSPGIFMHIHLNDANRKIHDMRKLPVNSRCVAEDTLMRSGIQSTTSEWKSCWTLWQQTTSQDNILPEHCCWPHYKTQIIFLEHDSLNSVIQIPPRSKDLHQIEHPVESGGTRYLHCGSHFGWCNKCNGPEDFQLFLKSVIAKTCHTAWRNWCNLKLSIENLMLSCWQTCFS